MGFKQALRAIGWDGKLLANVMPWVGEPNHVHRCTSYNSDDPITIKRQADNMQMVGIDGVILTWRGIDANGGWDQRVAINWVSELSKRNMLFAYMPDPNLLKYKKNPAISDTNEIIRQFKDPSVQTILNSSTYMAEGYVFDFLTGYHVDWNAVKAVIPKINALMRHVGYEWPGLAGVSGVNSNHKNPNMKVPGIAFGFNDGGMPLPKGVTDETLVTGRDYNTSVWGVGPARVNDPQAGKYFMDVIDGIAASSYARLAKYAAIVTWNDYDEGTDIESFVAGLTGVRIG